MAARDDFGRCRWLVYRTVRCRHRMAITIMTLPFRSLQSVRGARQNPSIAPNEQLRFGIS